MAKATKAIKATKTTKATKATKTTTVKAVKTPKTTKATPKITKTIAKPKKVVAIPAKSDKKTKKDAGSKSLQLCLLCDCTGSMASWIQRSKETLSGIIKNVQSDHAGLTVTVAFVGYRDVQDKPRFEIFEFSEDLDACAKFIGTMKATGGGDAPEDVQGGLQKALEMKWTTDSAKQVFLICDAPGHGKDICDDHDNHPKGSPDGYKI